MILSSSVPTVPISRPCKSQNVLDPFGRVCRLILNRIEQARRLLNQTDRMVVGMEKETHCDVTVSFVLLERFLGVSGRRHGRVY
jgi:hypothetical protein